MNIWVDADGTPKAVKEILFRAAHRRQIHATFVANRILKLPPSPYLTSIVVGKGFDVADHKIVELVEEGDLVITSDVPLAALVIEEGAIAISFRGAQYDESNIAERLSMRNFFQDLRDTGVETGGPKAFGEQQKRSFAAALDRLLTQMTQDAD